MKNVIFDFGGVLINWNPDLVYLPYFDNNADKMNEFYSTTKIKDLNLEIDCGLPFDVALRPLSDKFPNYKEAIILWKNGWHKMLGGIIDDNVTILEKLCEKGYNVYGLTNWSAETFPYAYYKYEFFQLFQDIVVSGREKLIKPDPKIFKLCLSRNNLKAQESVFIDDNLDNVNVAMELGLYGIHFIEHSKLDDNLSALSIVL